MHKKVNWNEKIKVDQKFGRLTVTELPDKLLWNSKIHCKCDCGKETQPWLHNLLCGFTTSCGCWRKESSSRLGKLAGKLNGRANVKKAIAALKANSRFHGDYGNEYRKIVQYFRLMHDRVNGKYKSKGITICDDWSWSEKGYNNFKSWLLSELDRLDITLEEFNQLPKYNGLSVDRMNNGLGYCPSNCRLATPKQQQRNRSNSKVYAGHHILDWADALSIPYDLIEHIYPDTQQLEVLIWLYSGCPSGWSGPVFPSSKRVI